MTRRDFLAAVQSAAGSTVMAAAGQAPSSTRPNFLLIITDQQTHNAFSAAGNPWLRTPAMDLLATHGAAVLEAHCAYPVCSPSRSTIFSSRLPHETGVMGNNGAIPADMPTMGEIFSAAGYRTVYGGKWHLPKSFDGMTGFKKIAGGHALGEKMDAPLAEACVRWLESAEARQSPFLMVASFMNPHDICDWIRRHDQPRTAAAPTPVAWPSAPANMAVDPAEPECIQFHRTAGYDLMSQAVGIAARWSRDDMRLYLHDYYRMVEAVDREVGRVLAALEQAGLASNTIVCFVSDHGEGLGAHHWAQKAAFWEEVVRVPMLWRGPGIRTGARVPGLATLADVLPTFCDFAGFPAPPRTRGLSLRTALSSGGAIPRPFVTSELRYQSADREGRMLRTARFKYVAFNSGARPEQLFDLENDPGETRNLATEAAARPALAEHRALLAGWLKETDDAFRLPTIA